MNQVDTALGAVVWTVYLFVSTFFAVCLITKKLFLNIHLSWTVPTLCCTATEGDPEGGPDGDLGLTLDDLGAGGPEVEDARSSK